MEEDNIRKEIETLRAEYAWVLREEVNNVLNEVHSILTEAVKRFPIQLYNGIENTVKPDKFVMSSANGNQIIKCMVTLMADSVCEADLTLKIHKSNTAPVQCKLYPDSPWRLQQIQDAGNHLLVALSHAERLDPDHRFTSAQQVMHILDAVLECLNRGRTSLALPKKRKLEELVKNPQLKGFKPSLPGDVVVSFYVHAQKLLLSVYQLYVNQNQKVDIQARHQLECSVPWLNEVLVLFTLALQLCQQLRDKIAIFVQYEAETKYSANPLKLSQTQNNIPGNISSDNFTSSMSYHDNPLPSDSNSSESTCPQGNGISDHDTIQETGQQATKKNEFYLGFPT